MDAEYARSQSAGRRTNRPRNSATQSQGKYAASDRHSLKLVLPCWRSRQTVGTSTMWYPRQCALATISRVTLKLTVLRNRMSRNMAAEYSLKLLVGSRVGRPATT